MSKKSAKSEDPDGSTEAQESRASEHSHSSNNTEQLQVKIIENLVQLQKVHTDLAEKFDSLTKQISSLLNLFEMTARSFSQNPANQVVEKDKEFLDKIDKLLDQNKTIARGLTLMDEKMREKVYGSVRQPIQPQEIKENEEYEASAISRPLPKF